MAGGATIEGIRVDSGLRGTGIGRNFFKWAIARTQERGCHVVQLTTDKQRPEAKLFYESLGFTASHESMKPNLVAVFNPGPYQEDRHDQAILENFTDDNTGQVVGRAYFSERLPLSAPREFLYRWAC